MTNKYNREFLLEYVESENKKNECNVSLENMNKIVSLIEYFGIELYRPITRLLLSNWEEITNRINNYTESDWMMADEIQKTTPTLDRFSIAMLIEVLEGEDTLNQAENAGRRLTDYAEIVGYGATSDGADMVAPSGEGAVRCMQMAMHGVDTPIDYLNSHGTSTPVGDVKELGAIREVFGDNSPAISATKAMTGHSLGAAGVQEAIYSLLMLEHGFIAPSINIEELDEQAAGLNIVTKPTEQALTTVMSNSFGFGGTNATLVMRKL